jgi:signal transduction histidine kinase
MVMELPRGFHEDQRMLDWEKTQEPIGIFTYDADGAIDYVDKMIRTGRFDLVDHNAPGPDDIRHIGGLTFVMARTTHGEIGYSLPGIIPKIPAADLKTLVRFAGVFDLAYKRFEDLKTSEQQTRQAQIELALERVRARTMAMRSSDELAEVSYVLNKQVVELGIPTRGCAFNIYGEHESTEWFSNLEGTLPAYKTPRENVFLKYYEAGQRGETLLIEEFDNERIKQHYDYLHSLHLLEDDEEEMAKIRNAMPDAQVDHVAYFKYGYLLFITLAPAPEAHDVFKRFAKEFEQTYTRFLDLQKAEAQAREAQIEAALERVRSRTMGMQRSDELQEAAMLLFQQVVTLGVPAFGTGFNIWDEDRKYATAWMAGIDRLQPPFKTSSAEDIFFRIHQASERGETLFIEEQGGESLKAHYDYMASIPVFKEIADNMASAGQSFPSFQIMHCAFFSLGYLMFITFEPVPEAYDIFKRFAKVFEQTYTRFLDLQKAEAQAREAQIEMSLEKVRSRTMGMQHSDELKEAAALLFQQVISLGAPAFSCGYNILEKDDLECTAWMGTQDGGINPAFRIPLTEDPNFIRFHESKLNGEDFYVLDMQGEALQAHYRYLRDKAPVFRDTFDHIIRSGHALPARQVHHIANFSHGNLMFITLEPAPEFHDIFKRFARVFDQTYTRFLDLKKAEIRAREAQIDVAVERVRAKALAMHKSEEIMGVARTLWQELDGLQIQGVIATTIYLTQEDGRVRFFDLTNMEGTEQHGHVMDQYMRLEECPDFLWFQRMFQSKDRYLIVEQHDEELKRSLSWIGQFINEQVAASMTTFFEESNEWHLWHPRVLLEKGIMNIDFVEPPPAETEPILIKMGAAFDLAYKRFLDLQKAEAQAREAQIETALERVRARAMAMQKSQELVEVVHELRTQMGLLGQKELETCVIQLYDESPDYIQSWAGIRAPDSAGSILAASAIVPKKGLQIMEEVLAAYEANRQDYVLVNEGEKLRQWFSFLEKASPESYTRLVESVQGDIGALTAFWSFADFEGGSLLMVTRDKPDDYSRSLLRRFSNVFGLAYRRFADIKQAEAQAREAQIEAALERVRSKTMAMHNSHEVGESVATLFEELVGLGVLTPEDRCGIGIMLPNHQMEAWTAAKTTDGKAELTIGFLDMTLHPLLTSAYQGWVDKKEINQYVLEGEDRIRYYEAMLRQPNYKIKRDHYTGSIRIIHNDFYFKEGCLYVFSERELSPASLVVYTRFAAVFGQTYRRYLDLQKAEAQAREAQIEAALESIRSKAMAMRTSEDIAETTAASFAELKKLGIASFRSGVGILTKGSKMVQVFADARVEDGQTKALSTMRSMDEHPALQQQYIAWEKQEDYEQFLSGDELITYYSHPFFQKSNIDLQKYSGNNQECGYYFAFPDGLFYAWSYQPYSEDEKNILRRFRNIISLTFRRYLDLQKAEAQAREATKQASLDRVRAVIAGMRSTEDLELITPLIFKELTILGIPFIRCGVFIIHEDRQIIDAYLSSPSGTSLGVLHLPFHASELTMQTVEAWRNEKVHRQHWSQADFIDWTKQMMDQHQIESSRTYQGADNAPESLDLHFVPFAQGMLYVGSLQALGDQDLELALALARSFSIAYARYEDFVKLETAKANIESTLTELRATQTQLIQSEKMASLGELTAGIAHEIQNPLNFVNNFSEINTELSAEILEAAEKGDLEEVKAIAADIRNNQEKISQHGKRADSIVKSMLQHSRSSSGAKEPTDLNKLADEYLRLAYHGFRAKDKNFNTNIKTDLAPGLPIIPVMTQDFGRVLLNLFNNALYAVNERKKTAGEGYAPEVCVTSRYDKDEVVITVSDNGSGIPDHIREKIFQPFFTTKPTGEGTGLGLSLSYDIIKAAGGEIKVDSEKGKGTSFTIILPNTQQ